MKCTNCDSKGAYRLRVDSEDWSTPLQIDGRYCSHDLTTMMDEVKKQIQAQVPNFELINNKRPATPLPVYTGELVRPEIKKAKVEQEEEEEDAVPPGYTPPEPVRKEQEKEKIDWSEVVQIKIRRHPTAKNIVSQKERERRRIQVRAIWDRGIINTYTIAEMLGCGRGAVYADLRAMGIKPKETVRPRVRQHYVESSTSSNESSKASESESESMVTPILQVQ